MKSPFLREVVDLQIIKYVMYNELLDSAFTDKDMNKEENKQ